MRLPPTELARDFVLECRLRYWRYRIQMAWRQQDKVAMGYAWNQVCELVVQRSPGQVKRMEKRKGLLRG